MNKRSISRRRVSGIRLLTVDIELPEGERIGADILDATAKGMAVVCNRADAPGLAVGSKVSLVVHAGNERVEFVAVVGSASSLNGFKRYGLEFQDPNPMDGEVTSPFLRRIFDRRVAQRVPFGPTEYVPVTVRAADTTPVVEGQLVDISATGVFLEASGEGADELIAKDEVELEFRLPGVKQSMRLTGAIQRCRHESGVALLSVEFEAEVTHPLSCENNQILDFVSRRVIGFRGAA